MKKHRLQNKFLDELRKVPIVQIACNKCGLSRNSVYRWRNEDPYFASLMNEALAEGDEVMNDLTESQLLSLIKDKKFNAIHFWLTHRHPKFKKQEVVVNTDGDFNPDEVLRELGLTDEDFTEENRVATESKITEYLRSK